MTQIQIEDRHQAQRLKGNIKRLITGELLSINPWWFIVSTTETTTARKTSCSKMWLT